MPEFLSYLEDRKLPNERWELLIDLVYQTDLPAFRGKQIVAPKGFVTDFASIPQVAQSFISKTGPWDRPAVIHDWLYKQAGFIEGFDFEYTREDADEILREGMKVEKVGWFRRYLIYSRVRRWGWISWNEHRNNRFQNALNKTEK